MAELVEGRGIKLTQASPPSGDVVVSWADGVVPIYSSADIPTPGGIPTFLSGTTYQIQEAIPDWPTQGVVMEDRSACVDLNLLNNKLTMAGTGTMFHGSGSASLFGLVLDAPDGGQLYDFDDPVGGEKSIFIESNQNLSCGKIGTFNDHAVTVLDLFRVQDCTQGLTFTGTNKLVHSVSRAAITTAVGAGFVAIDQTNMVTAFLEYDLHLLSGPAGSVAYGGLANSGNMQAGNVGSVLENKILGGMTTLQGLSDDDEGYRYVSTSQVKDSTILGSGYITAETATTISDGTDEIIAGTYTQSEQATQAAIDATGVITTSNRIPSRAIISAIMVTDKPAGGVDNYIFRIQRDAGGLGSWVDIPETIIPKAFQGAETSTVALKGPTVAEADDDFRIVVRGNGTTNPITVKSNIFTIEKI